MALPQLLTNRVSFLAINLVIVLLAIICSAVGQRHASNCAGMVLYVFCYEAITSIFIILFVKILNKVRAFQNVDKRSMALISFSLQTIMILIASIVAASLATKDDAFGATAFFGFLNVAFLLWYMFMEFKNMFNHDHPASDNGSAASGTPSEPPQ